jgi:methyl-accepting chemotaxis protein
VLLNICFGLYSIGKLAELNWRAEDGAAWTEGVADLGRLQDEISSVRRIDLINVMTPEAKRSGSDAKLRAEAIDAAQKAIDDYTHDAETLEYDTEKQRQDDLAHIKALSKQWDLYISLSKKLGDMGNSDEAVAFANGESRSVYDPLMNAMIELMDFNVQGAAEGAETSRVIYARAKFVTIAVLAFVSVVSLFVAFILARTIIKPIKELSRAANAAGDGDLTTRASVSSNDEFGELAEQYNVMIEHLDALISVIRESSDIMADEVRSIDDGVSVISGEADGIASGIDGISAQTSSQTTHIDTVMTTFEDMTRELNETTSVVDEVARDAVASVEKAKEGRLSVDEAVTQMNMIKETVHMSAEVVSSLGARSQEIGEIVGTISGISSQTNLLALNAAIEAARAGEQGRGFAVVADEVKQLAGESQTAAEKIEKLISSIQVETQKAVEAMTKGREEVTAGSEAVKESGRAFNSLVEVSVHSSESLQKIAGTMHSLTDGVGGIVSAIQNIENEGKNITEHAQSMVAATEEQVATIEQISASISNMEKIADDLTKSTHKFKV